MMSARGSRPKMASESVTDPASPPSSVVTFSSMSRTPSALSVDRDRRLSRIVGELEFAGLWHAVRQLFLHGIAHCDPAAFDARNSALDQDEAALDIGLHDFEIERGHPVDAQMTRHLLVLERLARILTAAGAADRTVRDRHAVAGAQAREIPALHRTGPAFAGRGAGDIDKLADDEMIRRNLGADRYQRIVIDPKLGKLALGFDLGNGEMAAICAIGPLRLARAGAELQRHVAILLFSAVSDNLAIAETKHRHRHVLTGFGEQPCHSHLLREHPGTHVRNPFLRSYSLI